MNPDRQSLRPVGKEVIFLFQLIFYQEAGPASSDDLWRV